MGNNPISETISHFFLVFFAIFLYIYLVAYCTFNEDGAVTEINHDGEEWTEIPMTDELGGYERKVEYKASKEQMEALVQLSSTCSQSIAFQCFFAPLQSQGQDR